MKKYLFIIAFLCVLLVQLACGTSTNIVATTEVKQNETEIKSAKATEVLPEDTKAPTNTPKPTNTPRPTSTPKPTLTPTLIPEPLVFTGNGNDVIDLDNKWAGPGIVYVKSTGDSNFIIYGYDQSGNENELVVNEIAPFEGYYPLGWDASEETTRLQIDAEGSWEMTVYPVAPEYIPVTANVPTAITGENNTLIMIEGNPDLLLVKAAGDSNFIVYGYREGWSSDLVVNEIAPFSGKYIIQPGVFLLVVDAEGPWEMEFTEK